MLDINEIRKISEENKIQKPKIIERQYEEKCFKAICKIIKRFAELGKNEYFTYNFNQDDEDDENMLIEIYELNNLEDNIEYRWLINKKEIKEKLEALGFEVVFAFSFIVRW